MIILLLLHQHLPLLQHHHLLDQYYKDTGSDLTGGDYVIEDEQGDDEERDHEMAVSGSPSGSENGYPGGDDVMGNVANVTRIRPWTSQGNGRSRSYVIRIIY